MPRKAGEFRFNAVKVGLTYSCPTNCDDNPIRCKQGLLDTLEEMHGLIGKYVVAAELHESGKTHYHCYLKFDQKIDSTNPHLFDVLGVHPNIIFSPKEGWIGYCKKHGDYISNIDENPWQRAMEMATPEEAIDHLWKTKPADMVKHGEAIERNIRKRKRNPVQATLYHGPWPQHYFPEYNDKTHSLLLYGAPDSGKSQFARYYMAHKYGDYGYAKSKPEALKNIDLQAPFIFDEVYMLEKDPQDSREITDVESGGSINARYGNVDIPPGVPRVFISNYKHPFKDPQGSVYNRRVVSHYISQSPAPDTLPDPTFGDQFEP